MTTERLAAVAGMFYPADKDALIRWLNGERRQHQGEKRKVAGLVLPHAGYVYSGACAIRALEQIMIPRRVIIAGLNHRYHHEQVVLDGSDRWLTPLGAVDLDWRWRDRLLTDAAVFVQDSRLGGQEHSLEVMVPMLQFFGDDVTILPLLLGGGEPDIIRAAAIRLAELIREDPDNTLLLASTDMSHYLSAEAAARADRPAIDCICSLDAFGLMDVVAKEKISMCGVFSTALVLETVRLLGGKRGEVICYTHSGVTSGDLSSVVAYLSAILV